MRPLISDQAASRAAIRIARHLATVLDVPLSLRLWDGTVVPLGQDAPEERCILLGGPAVVGSLLRRPTLDTLFRLYVAGAIDVRGTDLLACFDLARDLRQQKSPTRRLRKGFPWTAVPPLLLARDRRPTLRHEFHGDESGRLSRRDDTRFVQFHYDASNEFYALFLDEGMVYSCAYFTDWANPLNWAQLDKLDLICRKLRLRSGETFLDIGSGWGALLCHAARHYGVRAHGVTLSQAQYDYARERIARLGLGGQVTVELRDYTSLEGKYDKIASIGMYEHVGIANYRAYFKQIRRLLKDGGIFLNHGITRRAKRDPRDFARISSGKRVILKYIFPGSELDHIGHTVQEMEACGFEVHDVEGLRLHYALTCRLWYRRLLERREEAIKLVGAERFRMWAAYLAGVSGAFERGPLRVYQTVASKLVSAGTSPLPPTRADLYRESIPSGGDAATA